LHPRILAIRVHGLEVERPRLLEQVSLSGVGNTVASHDIAMHVLLALCTIQAADVNLPDKLYAYWAFL
jgi:hypothetical protein